MNKVIVLNLLGSSLLCYSFNWDPLLISYNTQVTCIRRNNSYPSITSTTFYYYAMFSPFTLHNHAGPLLIKDTNYPQAAEVQ